MPGIAGALFSGWNTSFLMLAHSGFPVTMIGRDNTNQAVRGNVRPNQYRALTYQNQTIDNWFCAGNTFCAAGVDDGKCAYGDAAAGQFGNTAIGTERSVLLQFRRYRGARASSLLRKRIDFRAEFFNLFNHPSFGPPGRSLATPATLGQITIFSSARSSTSDGIRATADRPRSSS
jgi:hypothetical protein